MESTMTIDEDGDKLWYNPAGELHRLDGPAAEYADGSKEWCVNGECHRTDGPAVEGADGTKEWYLNGQRHRTDGPAVERADGYKLWYLNGKLHRTNGPAVERADGSKVWYLNDEWLGDGTEGFWALWYALSDQQRADLNVQLWAAKYT